ncbi:MFS transporter [Streptomyces antimycoticus]|uniref:MFS transporter n=1 Tax=Streptomyces antimycoticus TaxID=68175 RepID=UPI0013751802|nr:MFS transporter [Streptomyces antimycoticus]
MATSLDREKTNQQRKVVAAGLIGNSVEWYEFFIYGTAASLVFNKLFFPEFDPLVGSLIALSTFAVGFVMRPIGSIVFGHFGDRAGRKSMLVITLTLMGVSTFGIGLLPTYPQVGIAAPIMLVLLRLVQGFSLGGEYGGSILMSVEHAGQRKGFFGAIVNSGVGCGLVMATGVYLLLSALPDEQFFLWGWRIPFLVSVVLIVLGLVIRLKVEESPEFLSTEQSGEIVKTPLFQVLRRYPSLVVVMCAAYLSSGVTFYIVTVFSLSYGTQHLAIPRGRILTVLMLAIFFMIAGMIVFGWLSDRVNRKMIFQFSAIGMALAPWLWFPLLGSNNSLIMFLGFLIVLVPYSANYGVMPSFFSHVFPAHIRYTGMSLGYTLGAVLAGGLAPIIATFLLGLSGSWTYIAVYMTVVGVISTISAAALKDYQPGGPQDSVASEKTDAACVGKLA